MALVGPALRSRSRGRPAGPRGPALRPEGGAAVGELPRPRPRAGAGRGAGGRGREPRPGVVASCRRSRRRTSRIPIARDRRSRRGRAVPVARGRRRVRVPRRAAGRDRAARGDAPAARRRERRARRSAWDALAIDTESYRVTAQGRPLDLTFKEFELLRFLASRAGRVFTRPALLREVWGYDFYGGTRTVDVHVRRLRAKLGPEHEHLIQTVRSVGYRAADAED